MMTGAATLWDHGTRPLQLWRIRGPSVHGPLRLLRLAAIF